MKRDDFIKTYLEGASLAPQGELVFSLIGQLYDDRKIKQEMWEQIEFMDDVVRHSGWTMKCRSCGKDYQPDCELSEMFGAENYCGGSQWCTP